ncbi:MAG: EpsG family protein [Dolichospermum circinale Clear-D4]|nr:EpsG family protein [Dolichospermum circinale Clear-D4]
MKELLFLICIPILYFYPVLYPPIASFTAIFFAESKQFNYLSAFLVFSAIIISSLIAATIIPRSDTLVYVESFKNAVSMAIDFYSPFEPGYQIYEYLLNILTGKNEKLFLLLTALIFNIFSIIGISRICLNLNQPNMSYIVICIYFSLVQPSMGLPLFLIRSNLSLAIMLLSISFFKQKQIVSYLLAIISITIHYGTIIILCVLIHNELWPLFRRNKIILRLFSRTREIIIIICLSCFLLTIFNPDVINSILSSLINIFGQSGLLGSNKLQWFIINSSGNDTYINIFSPLFIFQIGIGMLCFLNLNKDLFTDVNQYQYLISLRAIGIAQILTIMITLPFSLLPVRLGLFYFLYFPLWVINIPFLSISKKISNYRNKYRKYLILFSMFLVLYLTLNILPKKQNQDYSDSKVNADLVVLEGKPLDYKLIPLIEYFL